MDLNEIWVEDMNCTHWTDYISRNVWTP